MPRILVSALALLVCLVAPGASQEKKEKNPIKVTYHGQSFYTIRSSDGTIVAFDPHAMPDYGRISGVRADIICVSHEHNEHNVIKSVEEADKAKVLKGLTGPGLKANWVAIDEKIKDVTIRSVGVFHDSVDGMRYGKNTVFVVEMDGWKIAHLGDLGHELTTRQLRQIGPVDVIMIPVGGIYTLNGSDAKRVVEQLKPKEYIFPMHYGVPKVFEDLLPIDEFLEDQPAKFVVKTDDNSLFLNKDKSRPRPLIVQLHYAPKEMKEKDKEKEKQKEK